MFSDEERNLVIAVMAAALVQRASPDTRAACRLRYRAGIRGNVIRSRTHAQRAGPVRPAPPVAAVRSQNCLIFAVDIAGFTDARRDDEVQLALRRALYRLLIDAFDSSGVPWESCLHEDRGDGVLVIVPAGIAAATMIDPVTHRLLAALQRHNKLSSEIARIQLRVAIHLGQVHRDEHGLAGTAVNHLCRLLDAPALKRALATSGSELALIVSRQFYDSVIQQNASLIDAATFRAAAVRVKQTRTHGWIWTPAVTPHPGFVLSMKQRTLAVGVATALPWGSGIVLISHAPRSAFLAAVLTITTGFVLAVTIAVLGRYGPRL